jgi:hypothetical protein
MSKGNILVVVNTENKKAIESVVKGAKPVISELGSATQFSFENLEVDLTKNTNLAGLQEALDVLGEDDYALCVTVDRKESLDIYGSPNKFGLIRVTRLKGFNITIH